MSQIRDKLHRCVDAMRGVEVAVVGDLVADVYVHARPQRLSREAPVVIARHEEELCVPGGGANVLANLAALGARPIALGRLGEDAIGMRLVEDLARRGVDTRWLEMRGATITLTRYMVGSANTRRQQVLRIDRFDEADRSTQVELPPGAGEVRGWVVSDYGYGAVGAEICQRLREVAAQGVAVVGDSRARLDLLEGFTLIKPNHPEAEAHSGRGIADREQALEVARELATALRVQSVLLTLGNLGMAFHGREPRRDCVLDVVGAREAVDVSGAGDTVCAVSALALAAGADAVTAAVLANRGAGVVVMHEGTTPLRAEELHQAIDAGGDEREEPDFQVLQASSGGEG